MGKRRAHVEERLISDATHRARTVSRIVKLWPKVSRSATGATRSTILGVGSSPLTPWTWILRCFARPGLSQFKRAEGRDSNPRALGQGFSRGIWTVSRFSSLCQSSPLPAQMFQASLTVCGDLSGVVVQEVVQTAACCSAVRGARFDHHFFWNDLFDLPSAVRRVQNDSSRDIDSRS